MTAEALLTDIRQEYQQMHTGTLKLVCTDNGLLHVSANHVVIFSEVKYKRWIHIKGYKAEL